MNLFRPKLTRQPLQTLKQTTRNSQKLLKMNTRLTRHKRPILINRNLNSNRHILVLNNQQLRRNRVHKFNGHLHLNMNHLNITNNRLQNIYAINLFIRRLHRTTRMLKDRLRLANLRHKSSRLTNNRFLSQDLSPINLRRLLMRQNRSLHFKRINNNSRSQATATAKQNIVNQVPTIQQAPHSRRNYHDRGYRFYYPSSGGRSPVRPRAALVALAAPIAPKRRPPRSPTLQSPGNSTVTIP